VESSYQAGLSTNDAKPLESWASPEPWGAFPGFYEGHYLSAISLMYAQSGEQEMLDRVNYMVAEMAKCQDAMGGKYMFASPENEFDENALIGVPWYRAHKIMEGLIAAYNYAGNDQALDILNKFTEWIDERVTGYGDKFETVKRTEYGGMQEAFVNLFEITQNPLHLELAQKWEEKSLILDKFYSGQDFTEHANTLVAKMVGASRMAEVDHNEFYETASGNFWDFVAGSGHKTYATGGTSIHEGMPGVNSLANSQARMPQETCVSYNLLKVTQSLYNLTGEAKYMDYYERSLFNSILGSQDPESGWKSYYQPLSANITKDFRSHLTGCYCCNGTGLENPVRYSSTIYSHTSDSLLVNLFIASAADWTEQDIMIEQTTNFPFEQTSSILVKTSSPKEFSIGVRKPVWCTSGYSIKVNDEIIALNGESYNYIRRTWNDGDIIEVTLPMEFSKYPMPDKANQVAFMYGPVVLVGYGANPFNGELVGDIDDGASWINNLNDWFQPVLGEPLVFTGTDDSSRVVTFKPYFEVGAKEFFTGYWNIEKESNILDDENLALGKKVLTENPFPVGVNVENFLCAEKAIDGRFGDSDDWYTKWFPNGMAPQWITVDLGEVYNINRVQWYPSSEDFTGKKYYKYKIECSEDNQTWEMYDNRSDNDTVFEYYLTQKPAVARYVKLTVLPVNKYSGDKARPKIAEIKVYETEDNTLEPKFIAPDRTSVDLTGNEKKYTMVLPNQNLYFSLDMDVVRLEMYSISSQQILSQPVDSYSQVWNISGNQINSLEDGIYIFRFYGKDKSIASRKSIVSSL